MMNMEKIQYEKREIYKMKNMKRGIYKKDEKIKYEKGKFISKTEKKYMKKGKFISNTKN